jgi:hypothetical protein
VANYRVSTDTCGGQHKDNIQRNKQKKKERKGNQLRLFKLRRGLLKISINLQTAFAADTHLAEGQWLKEQLNVVKLRMF